MINQNNLIGCDIVINNPVNLDNTFLAIDTQNIIYIWLNTGGYELFLVLVVIFKPEYIKQKMCNDKKANS